MERHGKPEAVTIWKIRSVPQQRHALHCRVCTASTRPTVPALKVSQTTLHWPRHSGSEQWPVAATWSWCEQHQSAVGELEAYSEPNSMWILFHGPRTHASGAYKTANHHMREESSAPESETVLIWNTACLNKCSSSKQTTNFRRKLQIPHYSTTLTEFSLWFWFWLASREVVGIQLPVFLLHALPNFFRQAIFDRQRDELRRIPQIREL